mmetsp:Transcript_36111/g.60880  ORF Transcript_36111/g.60880 Transcript_36111/m.60880 type:complete len:338 (+) Transcript_36111:151-1164(+)|eukprot:CAMPEP_0198222262 /NCGR_PEP_ID=MMETSP1445-20131203/87330_1 /TAXON_ID=36898 /ORGANISM="Pyramimonas sp., Strain CCMP2087" /LENGTH=337 /DNA_ID=CAMNT_0043900703 /DNA_START=140 /DNA_END=1153 /DNA_ORIENTATION=-
MKRAREDEDLLKAEQVADHYSNRQNQSRQQRQKSPIFHLRLLNNWIKSVLIHRYTERNARVLDLACGKGGDLPKWRKANIEYYCGIDIAKESVKSHARNRYNKDNYPFPAHLMCVDAFQVDLKPLVPHPGTYDLCSCQFAFHYSFATEARARQTLKNVSSLLRPGGYFIGTTPDANVIVKNLRASKGLSFGNGCYKVEFSETHADKAFLEAFGNEYNFTLTDAVDGVAEYLVPFRTLEEMAKEEGLALELRANFHDFFCERRHDPEAEALLRQMKVLEDPATQSSITADEWEASRIYIVFAFRKVAEQWEINYAKSKRPPPGEAQKIAEEDVVVVEY